MFLWIVELVLLAGAVQGLRSGSAKQDNTIPVDFFVFRGKDGDKSNVPPLTSMNINPPDNVTGFYMLCKDQCPVFDTSCGAGCTAPQMRWCRCVAELLVKDLSHDFHALMDDGSPPIFTLGDYVELSAGQEFFNIPDGHKQLYSLMEADGSHPYARRAGRVAVWVANHIASADDHGESFLAGTTLLDQPLWQGGRGAGVLFHAQQDRSSKILSHEVGHVVGFHHTAGPSMLYHYDHAECPKEYRHVEMHPLIFPSCEVNIMGYWYDGPYCCPGGSASLLLQLRGGRSRRNQCLEHDLNNFQEAHCCGSECSHSCSKIMPEPTFDTKAQEHNVALGRMLKCWLHLRSVPEPAQKVAPGGIVRLNVTSLVRVKPPVACVDYAHGMGTCS